MRNYHIVTNDGERNLRAARVHIDGGALVLTNDAGEVVVAYAEGAWVSIELETRDDRGE